MAKKAASLISEYFADHPHVCSGLQYAEAVVAGDIPAGKYTKAACRRQLDDLLNIEGYLFAPEKAERVCKFIELLPHTKGRWAARRKLIELESWQCFILITVFGWIDSDGHRRFREIYAEVPRKNGKSILAAGVGLYCLVEDDEYGAEVYSGATSEKQAWEVFKPARLMAMKANGFIDHYGIDINAKSLSNAETGSKFEPIIGNPGDGSSPSCAIVDEYHEHKTDELVSTMETGMGAREQGLLFKITTAGFSTDSPCYHQSIDVKKMLDGVVKNDRLFAIIYHADESDEWDDPVVLQKANPNYGVSVDEKYLIARLESAKGNPRKQRDYKTKHLNLWGGAKEAWLDYPAWVKCGDDSLKESDFNGEPGVFSADLSSKIDITADGRLFSRIENGKTHYYFFLHSFLPEETIQKDRSGKYAGWVVDGWMETTEGNEIDFDVIRESVNSGLDTHPNSPIVYDPWRATQLAQEFQKDGAEVMEFRLTPANCTDAMKELEAAILAGRFHHNNNPVLNWMASNVVTKKYIDDMMKPDKEKPENKIDGMVALIMAVGYALNNQQEQGPMVAYI